MTTGKALNGKPYAGCPHVRCDEGEVAPAATPRRGSLLYRKTMIMMTIGVVVATAVHAGENPVEYFSKAWNATESRQWGEAARNLKRCIEIEKGSGILRSDCNIADNYVWLAMLQWNDDEASSARSSMSEAIYLMKNGEYLGGGCEKLAEKFLEKMRSGGLPSTFSTTDILSDCGVRKHVVAPMQARYWSRLGRINDQSRLVTRWAESMTRTYQMEADSQARMARQTARQEYLRSTGREFSPDRDTRPSSGKARDEWDSCKRIYDIFE